MRGASRVVRVCFVCVSCVGSSVGVGVPGSRSM